MKRIHLFFVICLIAGNAVSGWFWRPAAAARGRINKIVHENQIVNNEDNLFSFHSLPPLVKTEFQNITLEYLDESPKSLLELAWESFHSNNFGISLHYIRICIELHSEKADQQQATLSNHPPREDHFKYEEMHYVGESYFVLGQVFEKLGYYKEALLAYNTCIKKYPYALNLGTY